MKKKSIGVASGSYCRDIPVRQIQPDLAPTPAPEDFQRLVIPEPPVPVEEDITDRKFELISAAPAHTKV